MIVRRVDPDGKKLMLESSGPSMVWLLIRLLSSIQDQEVPGWARFLSATREKPKCLTTTDYYPVTSHPITEYKTVQEVLRYSEEATHEVGQEYIITTFDLGVCMKAYPIIWNSTLNYISYCWELFTWFVLILR